MSSNTNDLVFRLEIKTTLVKRLPSLTGQWLSRSSQDRFNFSYTLYRKPYSSHVVHGPNGKTPVRTNVPRPQPSLTRQDPWTDSRDGKNAKSSGRLLKFTSLASRHIGTAASQTSTSRSAVFLGFSAPFEVTAPFALSLLRRVMRFGITAGLARRARRERSWCLRHESRPRLA